MTKTEHVKDLYSKYVMPTYAPQRLLVKGLGTRVWDSDNMQYLDFAAGIAVLNVGHCHPHVVGAVQKQAADLMHVSNLYFNEPQALLAEKLSSISLHGKCFFANSGAEANEGLIKLARYWGHDKGKFEIICMEKSFHGRTLATASATGQDKVKKGFEPMPEGFYHVEFNDIDAVRAMVTDETAGILIEAIQGEGGVRPARPEFVRDLKALCEEYDLLLLCDEIQCGMGRTGTWWGFEAYDVQPDAFSTAKAFGGGFPIGAVVAGPKLSDTLPVGSHASTFGGNPLACAAALATIEAIEQERLLERTRQMGQRFIEMLKGLVGSYEPLVEVRGSGFMIGMDLNTEAKPLSDALAGMGLLTIPTAGNVVRLLPPLNVKESELNEAYEILVEAFDNWKEYGSPAGISEESGDEAR